MDLQKLKAFLCVAKWRSFTKASAELFISQPALSKKISDFENELGVTLLIRDNRTVELTEAGQLLCNEAPILLKFEDDLQCKVKALGENPDSCINIGCTGIEYGRLQDTVFAFREKYPDINLSLHKHTAAEIRRLILANMLDIAFQTRFEIENEPDIDSVPFDQDDLYVVVGKHHPLAEQKEITLNQLMGECYIGIQPVTDHLPFSRMINMLLENGYNPSEVKIAENVDELILAVSCGLAVGHLFGKTRKNYGGILSYLKIKDCSMQLHIEMVWNRTNRNKAKQKLIDFVMKENQERASEL